VVNHSGHTDWHERAKFLESIMIPLGKEHRVKCMAMKPEAEHLRIFSRKRMFLNKTGDILDIKHSIYRVPLLLKQMKGGTNVKVNRKSMHFTDTGNLLMRCA